MIGARDMAFPKLNALSYWLLLAGGIVFYGSLFFHPPEAGWTSYAPLSLERLLADRRHRRVDLPHPPHRHLVAARRDQLLRDDRATCARPAWAGAACRCSSGRSSSTRSC